MGAGRYFLAIEVPDSIPLPPLQAMMAKRDAIRRGHTWTDANSRIPLDVCIDPQFEMLQPFFKKVKPEKMSDSIYKEVDPQVYLDMYGKVLPTKVEHGLSVQLSQIELYRHLIFCHISLCYCLRFAV
uniref:Uncharacterized protein n=1 Tax=Ditylenchus dipsaci TaxID=166011 RepID=A0A915CV63_9BILA